jgi:hypothetical protein
MKKENLVSGDKDRAQSTDLLKAKAIFFIAAMLSFLLSIYIYFVIGDQQNGIYVGLWVPSILSAGTLLVGNR